MAKKARNTLIVVVILLIVVAFIILKNVNTTKGDMKIISGFITEKTKSGNSQFITIETFGKSEDDIRQLKMRVLDKELWNSIEENRYYFINYIVKEDKSLVLSSIERNDEYGKIYKKATEKEEEKEDIKEVEKAEESEKQEEEEGKEKFTAIYPSTDKLSIENLTLLDSTTVDINGDGKEETIELYTTAQRDSKGEIMWDDGQKWFLIVKDKDKEYVLFDEYVQLGTLEFWVYDSRGESHIVTLQTGSAVLKLSDYVYDSEKDCYVKKDIFNPEYLNVIYDSTIK